MHGAEICNAALHYCTALHHAPSTALHLHCRDRCAHGSTAAPSPQPRCATCRNSAAAPLLPHCSHPAQSCSPTTAPLQPPCRAAAPPQPHLSPTAATLNRAPQPHRSPPPQPRCTRCCNRAAAAAHRVLTATAAPLQPPCSPTAAILHRAPQPHCSPTAATLHRAAAPPQPHCSHPA